MTQQYFILINCLLSCVLVQISKPFIHFWFSKEWKFSLVFASGGMPSSHSSTVTALCYAVGYVEGTQSSLFAICLIMAIIVCFDAANVRYYAGKNIDLTQKLINDLKELSLLSFKDPIYEKKMKAVLGHTYFEVAGGIISGLIISMIVTAVVF